MRIILFPIVMIACLSINSFAQQNQTSANQQIRSKAITIVKLPDEAKEPIKVIIQTNDQGENWLKDAVVEVENISSRPIRYLECIVLICDIKGSDSCVTIPLTYGKLVSRKISTDDILSASTSDTKLKETKSEVDPIPPNGKIQLIESEAAYNSAKALVEKAVQMSTIRNADFVVQRVYFGDGTGWTNDWLFSNLEMSEPVSSGSSYSRGASYSVPKDVYVRGYVRSDG